VWTQQRRRMHSDLSTQVLRLERELENFEEIARNLLPTPADVPRIHGFDIFGGTLALNGPVGGDLLIYLDFKERFDLETRIRRAMEQGRVDVVNNLNRCRQKAGIAVIDVSGHRVTDAVLAAMLHQAFLLGAIYELDLCGKVTRRLFENLNTQFYEFSSDHKFVSLIYGEISTDAQFRFFSAAQPFPRVFSNKHDRFMNVSEELCLTSPPLGLAPSLHVTDGSRTGSPLEFPDDYKMNHWALLGEGDILLLQTDGLTEHRCGDQAYCPDGLERTLRSVKLKSAAEIFRAIESDLLAFAAPCDDISLVVIKRL
jgi:serine phosphatase RsbU (regulator of sigma subunit)